MSNRTGAGGSAGGSNKNSNNNNNHQHQQQGPPVAHFASIAAFVNAHPLVTRDHLMQQRGYAVDLMAKSVQGAANRDSNELFREFQNEVRNRQPRVSSLNNPPSVGFVVDDGSNTNQSGGSNIRHVFDSETNGGGQANDEDNNNGKDDESLAMNKKPPARKRRRNNHDDDDNNDKKNHKKDDNGGDGPS